MPDDPDIRLTEAEADEVYSPERRQTGPDKKKIGILAAIGAVVIAILGGIFMSGSGGISKEEARLIQTKIGSLEQRIVAMEKQQAALQAKLPVEGAEGVLAGKVDSLAQRIEALEKKPIVAAAEKPKAIQKEKPAAVEKPKAAQKEKPAAASSGKKSHTVEKGETIYGISKKYGMKPADLRRLNNLGTEDSLKPGQKLIISK